MLLIPKRRCELAGEQCADIASNRLLRLLYKLLSLSLAREGSSILVSLSKAFMSRKNPEFITGELLLQSRFWHLFELKNSQISSLVPFFGQCQKSYKKKRAVRAQNQDLIYT